MIKNRERMCVEWIDRATKKRMWCAVDRLDPDASRDATLCGAVVILRVGSEMRVPTCEDCRAAIG